MQRTFPLLLAALLLALPGLCAANAISTPPEEQLTSHTDARFGRVLFIRNEAAQPTASDAFWRAPLPPSPSGPILNTADLAQPEWAGAVATARDFLRRHASDFLGASGTGVPPVRTETHGRDARATTAANAFSPDTDLVPLRAERDALGMTHVRFTQTYRGLPVFGADATVHLAADGRVSSAGARLVPDIQMDIQPTLTREQAVLVAVALWQAQFQRTETPEATSTNLCLLAPGLLKNDGNPATHLVWEVKLILGCKDCPMPQSNEHYYIDAHSGELREQISGIQRLDRRVQDCSANPGSNLCYSGLVTNGYHYGRREGESSWGPNPKYNAYDTDTLYDLLGNVHAYLALKFGRNGANGQGGLGNGFSDPYTRTRGQVYINDIAGNSPSCTGAIYQMGVVAFCYNTVVPDVVAHEYMHGLPDYSVPGGLNYSGQSGTLNESQCDVWGQLFVKYLTGATDWVNWSEGPDAGKRDLSDPPLLVYWLNDNPNLIYHFPDRFHSPGVCCGGYDAGGVHINSTIVSKGAYLIAEGGLFNGCTISGIGTDKLEQILYRVVTQYYSSSSSFNSAYYNWIQAAADLYGANSPECLQTRRAMQSVELDQPGYCSGLPARPPAALDPVGW